MLFRYLPFKETLYSNETGGYTSFGIKAIDENGLEVLSMSDVSLDPNFVSKLCFLCTELDLSPIHLMDVIEDHL